MTLPLVFLLRYVNSPNTIMGASMNLFIPVVTKGVAEQTINAKNNFSLLFFMALKKI